MTNILHKTKSALARHEREHDSDSIKQRQNSEKARQNGTHPDVQQDKNESATTTYTKREKISEIPAGHTQKIS